MSKLEIKLVAEHEHIHNRIDIMLSVSFLRIATNPNKMGATDTEIWSSSPEKGLISYFQIFFSTCDTYM